jgi:CRISPR system Cascade subunit CasE
VRERGLKLEEKDFEGKLKIVDADRFKKELFQGVRSAKAFGCGLMLVKRI